MNRLGESLLPKHLAVEPYERSAERQGHANGYKPKTLNTRRGGIPWQRY